jgi:hypothetical protein
MNTTPKKKNLQVQLPAELFDAIAEIAEYENKPVARVVREMLEALGPGIFQACEMMRAAQTMTEEARKTLLPDLERHAKHMEHNVEYGLENIGAALKKAKSDPPQHKLPI